MHGNVAEWIHVIEGEGFRHPQPSVVLTESEDLPLSGARGGSWAEGASSARSRATLFVPWKILSPAIGFRLVVDAEQEGEREPQGEAPAGAHDR